LHALTLLLNELLGNVGSTLTLTDASEPGRVSHQEAIATCAAGLREGTIETLLILGGNPAYNAPADLAFGDLVAEAKTSIHLSLYDDETSRRCQWHLPRAHPLEAWGDLRAHDGSLCVVQPLIMPLHGGKTAEEILSYLTDESPQPAHDITRQTFHELGGGRGEAPSDSADFQKRWRQLLHDGFQAGSTAPPAAAVWQPREGLWHKILLALGAFETRLGPENLELVITSDAKVHDGRFANNPWLQELPDFLTKLTWDNAALLSPATAAELKVTDGDLVALRRGQRELVMPICIVPGLATHSVQVNLGYGRSVCGRVGDGVGFDTYQLRTSSAPWGGTGLRISKTGRRHPLATTQDHHAIDTRGARERQKRTGSLIREASLQEYRAHPDFVQHLGGHHPPLISLWKEHSYAGHRWGMAVDLNRCLGCQACVMACMAENNIPVVGKEQVLRGREMHWLRVDRYFQGDPKDPRMAHQPVACMHCEMAPCEQVCPVAATVHSQEGLNVMVYNRCVGTRYCSNNCPYKVRRFNFFNYRKHLTLTQKMAFNPEVTVRSRGVMEKCTYCLQRIQAARIKAKSERRPLQDGDIVPACAQTCPTGAIVFGDLNDPDSRVARLHAEPRAYVLLAELNIKPRTAYLARIRNPNPELQAGEHGAAERHGSGG
jgi:molybdopterin-containing oxidoreductase family iron-sulfur binding subunit